MKKKIFVLMVILLVASMMVSCNSCMRSSAEPAVMQQSFDHLDSVMAIGDDTIKVKANDINKQPVTNQAQRDSLYLNLEKTEKAVIGQQQTIDSLLMDMMKNKKK